MKPQLLDMAMDAAQRTNDPVQVATWYDRTIANDPNDIPARVIFAEVTAAQIRENDLDKATNVKKVQELAHKALDLIQSGGTAPVAVQPDQAEGYKKELAGRAWTAIAITDYVDKRPADAVADYKKGMDFSRTPSSPPGFPSVCREQAIRRRHRHGRQSNGHARCQPSSQSVRPTAKRSSHQAQGS